MAGLSDLLGYPIDEVVNLPENEFEYLQNVTEEEIYQLLSTSPEMQKILQERVQARIKPFMRLRTHVPH